MTTPIIFDSNDIQKYTLVGVPALFANEGERAAYQFIEFFAASIRNPNTRAAYMRAVYRFADWCEDRGVDLLQLNPVLVAAYVEELGLEVSKPTVKQHLAAIRMLFDHLLIGQVVPTNPAQGVKGPKYVVKKGKTPVLVADEMKTFLASIPTDTLSGLRDRAIIGIMAYSFARVGAVVGMNIEDYVQHGRRMIFRLHEKGGKLHQVPAHHTAEEYVDAYLAAAGLQEADKKSPLFRSFNHKGQHLSERRLRRTKVVEMIKRRARQAGIADNISSHTFRATGITNYLRNGGTLDHAQQIAAHESSQTTKLYDRRNDEVSLDEIERIRF